MSRQQQASSGRQPAGRCVAALSVGVGSSAPPADGLRRALRARVAARTVTAAIRILTAERDLAVGIVACLQTHGSRANWHPRLHLLATDGGFRTDGTFVSWPVHDTARSTEAFRRAVLRRFGRLPLFDEDQAAGMLPCPHSGFHVHTAVWVPEDDRAFATRLARYCARNPVALERLTYDRAAKAVTYRSDKSEGSTAGTETADPFEFLVRVLVHIPDKGHVTTRYYGWYANRPRGMRSKAAHAAAAGWLYARDISFWEIAVLVSKGRLELAADPQCWLQRAAQAPGSQLLPLTRDVLVASTSLAGTLHGDPADRMLLAQAQRVGCALLSCVKALLAYAERHSGVPVCGAR